MIGWKGFTTDQLDVIYKTLPEEGIATDAGWCPSCSQKTIHWYIYPNLFSCRQPSQFYYMWCRPCRLFYGQTIIMPKFDLADPLEHLTKQERSDMASDFDYFFTALDDLWSRGLLPQLRK